MPINVSVLLLEIYLPLWRKKRFKGVALQVLVGAVFFL